MKKAVVKQSSLVMVLASGFGCTKQKSNACSCDFICTKMEFLDLP